MTELVRRLETGPGFITLTAAAHPFRVSRDIVMVREGPSLAAMLEQAQPDPILRQHAVIFIAGHLILERNWPRVFPRAGTHVEIRVLPSGKKNILRSILMVVVAVAAIAAPYLAPVLVAGLAAGLGVSAVVVSALITTGVGLVGSLLVNALVPVRPPRLRQDDTAAGRVFSIEGARNQARPFQTVPQVLGRHRITPDYGAAPYTEIIGDDQYLRLLFVWGIGPLKIDEDSLRIGETPISEFEGVKIEHRAGYPDDEPLTLFHGVVVEENLTIKLETDEWNERTSAPETDQLSIDLMFPEGCVYLKGSETLGVTVVIVVLYRAVGTSTWQIPEPTILTLGEMDDGEWTTGDLRKREPFRIGMRWRVDTRGQYEVRVKRTSKDWSTEEGRSDDLYWTTLRSFGSRDPITSRVPVAKTALRIRATDQLNGVVDEFSGIVTTIGRDWDGSIWAGKRLITNPASLFRHILQGLGNAAPLADSRIDLPRLEEWHSWCAVRGYTFNHIRQGDGSVWDALADCAAAGRAAPGEPDGKWAPIIDHKGSIPVSHITPRNSFDFQVEKAFIELPHAFRIAFPNEDEDFRPDERRVYRDGYSVSNATKFEQLDLPGCTDPAQVWKIGRYRLAQGIHQPERFTFHQDMEFLTYQRGDRVAITHDVLLVGLHSGRVKAVTLGGANSVIALEIDETVTMEVGQAYGVAIRTLANAHITRQVTTIAGEHKTVTLSTSIPAVGGQPAVGRGDVFGFGLLGAETDDAQIVAIAPETDFRALVTAVPYRDAVYDSADSETIPPFETNLTPPPAIPRPTITRVVSNETALVVGEGGVVRARIIVAVKPLQSQYMKRARLEVQGRPSSSAQPFDWMAVDERTQQRVAVSGVRDRETWDLRVRFAVDDRLVPGPWAYVYNHTVIGKSTPPAGLIGLTISAFGGQAFLRWQRPKEIDVLFGGEVRFRHSPRMTGATWANSVTIGRSSRSTDLIATLPLKAGTYLARVYDSIRTPSVAIATVTTKQASVLTWGAATRLDEDPAFPGTHAGTVVDGTALKIDSAGLVDTIPVWDAVANLDAFGGTRPSGTYNFFYGFDYGAVVKRRLTTRIDVASTNVLIFLDDREERVDDWEDWDGDEQGVTDARIEVRHTDDPVGSPTWSAWEQLDSAEFEARAFDFRVVLTSEDPAFNIFVTDLGVDSEAVIA